MQKTGEGKSMRFLIDRYSSPINTECLYIYNELIKNGYVAKIREYNENIFDVFNLFKPDGTIDPTIAGQKPLNEAVNLLVYYYD